MKERIDFVSNSSSCSFLIHLRNEEDAEAFKKVFDDVRKHTIHGEFEVFYSLEDPKRGNTWSDFVLKTPDEVEPHTIVKCDSGEDHDLYYDERFNEMKDALGDYPFMLYVDPEAHTSAGYENDIDKLEEI